MKLLKVVCIPIMLYVVEALASKAEDLKFYDRCVHLALGKIFNTWSQDIISDLKKFLLIPSSTELLEGRRERFLMKSMKHDTFRYFCQSGLLRLL